MQKDIFNEDMNKQPQLGKTTADYFKFSLGSFKGTTSENYSEFYLWVYKKIEFDKQKN